MTDAELTAIVLQLQQVAGRIKGFIPTVGAPSNMIGAVGSVAWDSVDRVWYGPKTEAGWPPGVPVTTGPAGLSAKQIVILTGLLAEGATDADFVVWLRDAQIEAVEAAVQPLVTEAAGSATAAAGFATAADASASTATTKAGEASDSATAAAGFATAADASASTATTKASEADSSATAAAGFATAADASASTATTKAGAASDSATAAAGSATTASAKAAAASTDADDAEVARAAAVAAQLAAEAARDEAAEIAGGDFVTGPAASTAGHIPTFATTSGKALSAGRPIGTSSGEAIPDRDAADARYRRASEALAQSDIAGLVAALAGKATPADISAAISALVNGAPLALDTLKELADALEDQDDAVSALLLALDGKQTASATLSALAALTTTTFGRGLLELADAAALKAAADVPDKASGADLRALTDDAKFIPARAVSDAAAPETIAWTASLVLDLSIPFQIVVLGGNTTVSFTNAKPGVGARALLKQPASGGPRTVAYASGIKFFGPTPSASTASNAVDMLLLDPESSTVVSAVLQKGRAA